MANSKRKREQRQRVSARHKAESTSSGFESKAIKLPSGVEVFRPTAGTTLKINIVPYTAGKGNPFAEPGDLYFERTYWAHRSVGSDSDMVVCPNKTFGKKCPICEARKKLNYDTHEELVKELAPKQRQLFNLVDLKAVDKGVQIWDISYHLFGKRLDLEIKNSDEDEGIEYFADPESGSTLIVAFGEKSFGGRTFGEAESIRFKPRGELDPELLEAAVNLDDCVVDMDYDTLKKLFLQEDGEDDDDDDDDDEPVKKSSKKKPTKGKKPAPVEDDDEDDDEDEDEWEEEPVKKSKPTKGKKPAPAEDDEDDEDEDEDDEPVKKSSKKKPTKPAPVDDEDDEDEDEDDEPVKKTRSKSKASSKRKPAPVEDDEDDDEWEEEDEEPVKSKPSKSKSKSKAAPATKSKGKKPAKDEDDEDDEFEWDDDVPF